MNKIYIGNLSYKTTEADLRSNFAQFGDIEDAVVIKERETGRSKGFGFITFKSASDADKALAMDSKDLDGRTIRVNIAKEREAGSGGMGGGRMGGGMGGGRMGGSSGGGRMGGGGRDSGGRDGGGRY